MTGSNEFGNTLGMPDHLALDVLEQIPTPVMAVDREFRIRFMNAAGRELLGKTWQEIENLHCYSLLNSTHCQTQECRMKQAMDAREGQRLETRSISMAR